jgi:ferric-dicitrate binding protein FerR (iron transport regulator)
VSDERDDRLRGLMMAALDGEIDDEGRRELDAALAADPDLRAEWDSLGRTKQATARVALRSPPEEVWDGYWNSVYNRTERGIAWILITVGAAVLVGWGAWAALDALLQDTVLPTFLKFAILVLVAGGALLLLSVIREKWFTARRDPYKGVQR